MKEMVAKSMEESRNGKVGIKNMAHTLAIKDDDDGKGGNY